MLKTLVYETKKLWQDAKRLEEPRRNDVDPSWFDDPLAEHVSWEPLKRGDSDARRLVQVEAQRVEFRPAAGLKRGSLLGLVAGLTLCFGPWNRELITLVGGLVVISVVVLGYCRSTTPIVFDRLRGLYWKGRLSPEERADRHGADDWTELEKIHAIQILPVVSRDGDTYRFFELNLVLASGDRLNVVDHPEKQRIIKDAHRLAAFLEVPVWSAV